MRVMGWVIATQFRAIICALTIVLSIIVIRISRYFLPTLVSCLWSPFISANIYILLDLNTQLSQQYLDTRFFGIIISCFDSQSDAVRDLATVYTDNLYSFHRSLSAYR